MLPKSYSSVFAYVCVCVRASEAVLHRAKSELQVEASLCSH